MMRFTFPLSLVCTICMGLVSLQAQETTTFTFELPSPFFTEDPDTLLFRNGSRYIGELAEDQPNGKGILLAPQGDTLYIGFFKLGRKHGPGRYAFKAGNVYQGTWTENRMQGQGEMIFYTGDRYVGDWVADRFHGKGTYYFQDGSLYEGDFFEGKRQGVGTFNNPGDGNLLPTTYYSGAWLNGMREGQGIDSVVSAKFTKVYIGQFHQDKYDGKGEWRLIKEGKVINRYEGNFEAGVRRGEGIYYVDEKTIQGTWEDDDATGSGRCISEEGQYVGEFVKGLYEGKGNFYYGANSHYEGGWVAGKRQGKGRMVWEDGKVYDGNWYQDQPNGEGTMYLTNGKVQYGLFKGGKMIQKLEDPSDE